MVERRKKLLTPVGRSSAGAGRPAALHVIAVRAGFRSAGRNGSLVRQRLLVPGLTSARCARLATGIWARATFESNGPMMARTWGCAIRESRLWRPRAVACDAPAGSSRASMEMREPVEDGVALNEEANSVERRRARGAFDAGQGQVHPDRDRPAWRYGGVVGDAGRQGEQEGTARDRGSPSRERTG